MLIRWDDFGPQQYEDMVSVLLSRLHPNARRIDGKGGDGGRDVQIVNEPDGIIDHAFELKSFTGRMNSSRRQQVARSLKRAATLDPSRWTLVVPIDPTPAEDKWFRELGAAYPFPITWHGKTWLDEKMSAFPDIRRYFLESAKDEVIRLLLELQGEQAIVNSVPDAAMRLRTLRERLNEIDPHYRYEMSTVTAEANRWPQDVVFSVWSADVRVDVYPKYAGATEDRPVTLTAMVDFGPEDRPIHEALGYGLEVTIPRRMISSLTVDAPAGLGGTFAEGELSLFPIDTQLQEPVVIALDILDGDNLVASCPIRLIERTGGPKGFIFSGTDSTGWLEIQLKFNSGSEHGEVHFQFNPQPTMPAALVPLFRWLDACQPPHYLKIRLPGGSEIYAELNGPLLDVGDFSGIVEALAYLQSRTGVFQEMSISMSDEDAQEILAIAILMKGETISFTWESLNLRPDRWGSKFRELERGGTMQFLCEQDISFDIEGVEIPIGRLRTHILSARLADPEAVQRDVASGLVPPLRLVPGHTAEAKRFLVPRSE